MPLVRVGEDKWEWPDRPRPPSRLFKFGKGVLWAIAAVVFAFACYVVLTLFFGVASLEGLW